MVPLSLLLLLLPRRCCLACLRARVHLSVLSLRSVTCPPLPPYVRCSAQVAQVRSISIPRSPIARARPLAQADNVGSNQMAKIRFALRGSATVLMGKNTMIRKIISVYLKENPGHPLEQVCWFWLVCRIFFFFIVLCALEYSTPMWSFLYIIFIRKCFFFVLCAWRERSFS